MRIYVATLLLIAAPLVVSARADEKTAEVQSIRCRVNGLFQPDRVDDLREELKEWPEMTLVSVDYESAEAEFRFDPKLTFPNAKPTQWLEQFDNKLRQLTRATFGVRPLLTVPSDKLQVVEIQILGLDCKGCSFAAYDAVARLKGVERATASFKDGLLVAWINPDEIDREKLEAALKQRRVTLKEVKP